MPRRGKHASDQCGGLGRFGGGEGQVGCTYYWIWFACISLSDSDVDSMAVIHWDCAVWCSAPGELRTINGFLGSCVCGGMVGFTQLALVALGCIAQSSPTVRSALGSFCLVLSLLLLRYLGNCSVRSSWLVISFAYPMQLIIPRHRVVLARVRPQVPWREVCFRQMIATRWSSPPDTHAHSHGAAGPRSMWPRLRVGEVVFRRRPRRGQKA